MRLTATAVWQGAQDDTARRRSLSVEVEVGGGQLGGGGGVVIVVVVVVVERRGWRSSSQAEHGEDEDEEHLSGGLSYVLPGSVIRESLQP